MLWKQTAMCQLREKSETIQKLTPGIASLPATQLRPDRRARRTSRFRKTDGPNVDKPGRTARVLRPDPVRAQFEQVDDASQELAAEELQGVCESDEVQESAERDNSEK